MALWNLSSVNTLRRLSTCSLGRATSMSPSTTKLRSSSSPPLFLKPPTTLTKLSRLSHFSPTPCSTLVRHFHSGNNSSGDDGEYKQSQRDFRITVSFFDEEEKKQLAGTVLYPNTVDLEKVRMMCRSMLHYITNIYKQQVGVVYYGVSVLFYNEGIRQKKRLRG